MMSLGSSLLHLLGLTFMLALVPGSMWREEQTAASGLSVPMLKIIAKANITCSVTKSKGLNILNQGI